MPFSPTRLNGPAGPVPGYPPEFAADGIDELIMGFGRRPKYRPTVSTDGVRLHVTAADTGDEWYVDGGDPPAGGAVISVGTVTGPASGLYLYLWNRIDAAQAGVTVTGEDWLRSSVKLCGERGGPRWSAGSG